MPSTLRTPAVYVEEITKFPPSVAAVATAIPAFVGYTEKAGKNNEKDMTPVRISSMLEYETVFGGAPEMSSIKVTLDGNKVDKVVPTPSFYLYHSLQLFYANGGGSCYIVSVGKSEPSVTVSDIDLKKGLNTLIKEDEPTLLVCPDAALLKDSKQTNVYSAMMSQCQNLQDRFSILDVFDGEIDSFDPLITDKGVDDFRGGVSSGAHLKYAAAYYPYLRSSISIPFDHGKITGVDWENNITDQSDLLGAIGHADVDLNEISDILFGSDPNTPKNWRADYQEFKGEDELSGSDDNYKARKAILDRLIVSNGASPPEYSGAIIDLAALTESYGDDDPDSDKSLKTYFEDIYKLVTTGTNPTDAAGIIIMLADEIAAKVKVITNSSDEAKKKVAKAFSDNIDGYFTQSLTILQNLYEYAKGRIKELENLLTAESSFYASIRQAVESQGVILPPSGAIAGVYARVDGLRGVWKAPANVGLNMVQAPVVKLSDEDHGSLNVDVTAGKSINAIRSYIGKGTMVMGARTLAGNDNEWRYVPVRRLFIFLEESINKACEQFLFEPNDANTWVRVRGMITNFLYNQWRAGALAGATPDEAFQVSVGLPITMTPQDILEGVMNVEVAVAAVRPAEFIVLKFSHKLQQS